MTADERPVSILLLEDSDLDVELLRASLRRGGVKYTLERVYTRADFESMLFAQEFDVILADFVLPDFDGLTALSLAHANRPDTPFIFVSGTLGEEVAIESFKRGATDYVIKQRLERLPAAIQRALSEKQERLARRQAEQRLLDMNATLEMTVAERTKERDLVWRLSQDLFMLADGDGRISSVNPAWTALLGRTTESIEGQMLSTLVADQEQPRLRDVLARFGQVNRGRDIDLRMCHVDGTVRTVSWTVVKLPNGQYYGAGRDISERLSLEAQLRQVQKMESIGQLTGGVAHDFNNLLTVILGNLETLQRAQSEDTPQRLRNAAANGLRGAERAAELIRSLLAFSRRQALEPQAVDINNLLTSVSDLLGRTLGEQIVLKSQTRADAWTAYVDRNQLENAIINLAVNARDAMGDGGTLSLYTENVELDAAYCEQHSDKTPGEYLVLTVADTGVGMTEDTISRAFDPFFTTKAEGEGTGLGLSQVYGFVKQSGGHVKIQSAPDAGTRVHLYLPRLSPNQVAAPVHVTESDALPRARPGETVLVVEDEEGVRAHATDILRELGYSVLEAGDGASGLTMLRAHPEIDLLFTDVGLPNGMNGKALAHAAQSERADLPVLFTSAYAAEVLVSDNRLDAGVALITKPYTLNRLAQRVRRALDDAVRARQGMAPVAAPGGDPSSPCVLLVEDDFMLRTLAVESLEAEDFEVQQAESIADCMAAVDAAGLQRYAVAIIDIGLPDGRGDVLAKTLRRLRADLPVLILSGNISQIEDPSFYGDPLVALLEKPYRRMTLLNTLKTLISHA